MPATRREKIEFAAFCANATTDQLREIVRKETAANRLTYARIAQAKLDGRGG